MLVNGEPIMSAVNTGSYVMHHSSGKIKDIKHSAGVITGLNYHMNILELLTYLIILSF